MPHCGIQFCAFRRRKSYKYPPQSFPPKSQLLARQQLYTRNPHRLCESRRSQVTSHSPLSGITEGQNEQFIESPPSAPKREGETNIPQCLQSIPVWEVWLQEVRQGGRRTHSGQTRLEDGKQRSQTVSSAPWEVRQCWRQGKRLGIDCQARRWRKQPLDQWPRYWLCQHLTIHDSRVECKSWGTHILEFVWIKFTVAMQLWSTLKNLRP